MHLLGVVLGVWYPGKSTPDALNVLDISCRIANALSNCNATTGDIISTTERLKQDLEITTQRQEIVSCFLRDYQLSNEEVLKFSDPQILITLYDMPWNISQFYCSLFSDIYCRLMH